MRNGRHTNEGEGKGQGTGDAPMTPPRAAGSGQRGVSGPRLWGRTHALPCAPPPRAPPPAPFTSSTHQGRPRLISFFILYLVHRLFPRAGKCDFHGASRRAVTAPARQRALPGAFPDVGFHSQGARSPAPPAAPRVAPVPRRRSRPLSRFPPSESWSPSALRSHFPPGPADHLRLQITRPKPPRGPLP